jgi:glycerol-3-phosphate dehydrogenase (NAD(P)+)
MRPIVVLGAGSWGTALAIQFARSGRSTVLWGRAEDNPAELARARRNEKYLPGIEFPPALIIEPDLARAVAFGDDLVLVVPSGALRAVLQLLRPLLRPVSRVAWASKGFELSTGRLPHQVAREVLGPDVPIAVLSGPTFAREVGAGLPTAMAVASPDAGFALELAETLSVDNFRAYTQSDIVGVEVGGAIKNVIAIAAGGSDGSGYGSNSRVFLITRGLAEMVRLGVALGARPETFMGLAGLGDLVLTCTDDQSRNRRFGRAIASGKPIEQAIAEIGQVVEGYHAAKAVHMVSKKLGVDMPICEHVYQVLYEGMAIPEVVQSMLRRAVSAEN